MFILVNPNNNVLIKIAETCIPIINNKDKIIECENEKATGYLLEDNLIYPKSLPIKMYEINDIPSKIKPYKYLYVEGEFIINPNYNEPDDYTSEIKNMENRIEELQTNLEFNYMALNNPTGIGSFSMNRKEDTTIGNYSTTLGYNTTASELYSHAEGSNSIASGEVAHVEGRNTIANGENQHVQGKYNIEDTENTYAHIVGGGTSEDDRKNIHTIDWDGNAEFAGDVTATDSEGNKVSLVDLANNSSSGSGDYLTTNNPTGTGSFSMNRKADTSVGQYSIALGKDSTASGNYSHSEGHGTTAGGECSHSEGHGTTAGGNYSHAEGYCTDASGYASHTEGSNTYATDYAHAEGNSSRAQEDYSHAEGNSTITKAQYSHTEGYCTIAGGIYSHVQGKYNIEDTENKYAHIVGGGTEDSDRKNIHTIDWNGNAYFSGNISIDGHLLQNGNTVLDISNYSNYVASKDHTHSNYALSNHTHSNYALSNHTHSYLPLSGGTLTGQLNYGNSTYYTTSSGVSKFNTTTVANINIGSTSDNQVYSYLYHALYLGSSTTYWINQKGNVCFNDMTVVGETTFGGGVTIVTTGLTIGATSILNSVFNLGSENASDGYRYYINGNATGRFKSLRYESNGAISSKRYKNDIEYKDFEFWHNSLMSIKPCTFYYKNDKETKHIGLIAEDLFELIPELVDTDSDGNPSAIEYSNLTIPLISEVQRLNSIINKQQDDINNLKSIIDSYLK